MKLKRLEILGFKSFPDRTVLDFQDGITGVVGPNGCGKSNIVDAIRWVMGEMSAKHLRGKSMEDVIFAGSENRPPTNLAEATMIFSVEDGRAPAAYADYSEISVKRRLYRSGESEYFLNNTPCRLRDINDLFLGTGVGTKAYSIIEQGKIGQVINAKPEQRRLILEEAAGISKFKSRKEAALRRIEATQGNLLRLSDIINELKRQINSLNRQARKAERYKEIEKELREIELHIASLDYLGFSRDLFELEGGLQELETQEATLAAKVGQGEAGIENNRLSLMEDERELMSLQEELYEKNNSVQLHQTSIDYKTREIETLFQQNEVASKEIELGKDRLNRVEAALFQANEGQVGIDLQVGDAQESYSKLSADLQGKISEEKDLSEKIEGLGEGMMTILKDTSDADSRHGALARRKVELAGRIGRDQGEIDEIDRQQKSLQTKIRDLQTFLTDGKQLKIDLVQQRSSVETTIQKQKEEFQAAEESFRKIQDQLSFIRSRLKSLEEFEKNFEGYKEGVRNIMMKRSQISASKDIYGTVAELMETDSAYEPAVGAVLGEKLQYVVVKSQEAGLEALEYLKTESSGRLSCIPLEVREEYREEKFPYGQESGVIGPLKDYVKVREDYRRISNYLLSDVYLVENLKKALQIWNGNGHRKTLVTLDGEVVDPAGIVSGGSRTETGQALLEKRGEIKQLRGELGQLESQLRQKSDELEQYRHRIGHLENSLETLRKDSHSEDLKVVHQEKDLHHIQEEAGRLSERRDRLSLEISGAMQEESEALREMEKFSEALKGFEEKRISIQEDTESGKIRLASLKTELEDLRQNMAEANARLMLVKEKKNQFEQDLQRLMHERGEAQTQLEEKRRSISTGNLRIVELKKEMEESRSIITKTVLEIQEKEKRHQDLKDKVNQLQSEVRNHEVELRTHRTQLENIRQSLNQKIRDLSEGRTKVQVLREQILERYHLDLAEIAPQYEGRPIDRALEEPRAGELREKLEQLGTVNLGAIEEFEELQQRYDFLNQQYQDLTASLEGLQRALQKVNRTTRKRLQETFEKVNQLFQEVFPQLFKGGHGELRLTDPENILDTGVEIVAQPPGKKLQNVTLLSGGEKALTAISLVFAIFLLKPSPFCLLDEVDAPLDDVNIERFNEMVRTLVTRSQFILITHNKRTMEMADLLYGITMEQSGVSKMVSVNLQ